MLRLVSSFQEAMFTLGVGEVLMGLFLKMDTLLEDNWFVLHLFLFDEIGYIYTYMFDIVW